MIEKVLFALGSVIAFEGFFLAIIPERLKKTLSQISIIPNKLCLTSDGKLPAPAAV